MISFAAHKRPLFHISEYPAFSLTSFGAKIFPFPVRSALFSRPISDFSMCFQNPGQSLGEIQLSLEIALMKKNSLK